MGETLADMYANVEKWDLRVGSILLHPAIHSQLFASMPNLLDIQSANCYLWGAEVLSSVDIPENEIWILAEPEYLGSIQESAPFQKKRTTPLGSRTQEYVFTQDLRIAFQGRGVSRILLDV